MIRWHFAEPDETLRRHLDSADWLRGAAVLKDNQRRTVMRVDPHEFAGFGAQVPSLVVKHDHPTRLRDRIKAAFRCKARAEFDAGLRLAGLGVPCAAALAWGKRGSESWLVTRRVRGALGFSQAWRRCRRRRARRRAFLRSFAVLIRRMLAAGVVHSDLHHGNVLVALRGDKAKCLLIDVYEARIDRERRADSVRQIMFLLGTLLPALRPREIALLRRAVFGELPAREARRRWDDAVGQVEIDFVRHRAARVRKVLEDGAFTRRVETAQGAWLIRRPMSLATAQRIADSFTSAASDPANVRHHKDGHRVVRVAAGRRRFIVHEFIPSQNFAAGRAERRWLNAFLLYGPGLHVAPHLARLTQNNRELIICKAIDGRPLSRALNDPPSERRRLLAAAGAMLARLHRAGFPGSLSADAIIVVDRPVNPLAALTLYHAEDMGTPAPLSPAQAAGGIAVLCRSLGDTTTQEKRWLLAGYRRQAQIDRATMRGLMEKMK